MTKLSWAYLLLSVLIFGTMSFLYSTNMNKKLSLCKEKNQIIINQNKALRKIVIFEKTFLPYFSDKTKDKLLATEGCLNLGG